MRLNSYKGISGTTRSYLMLLEAQISLFTLLQPYRFIAKKILFLPMCRVQKM